MSALNNKSPYVIDDQKISFTFDGKKYFGFKGDTIASALLRNNIRLMVEVLNIIDQEESILVELKNQTHLFKYQVNTTIPI